MATFISSASSSFLILQPLKPPKHSRLSKAKTLTSTIKATSSQPKPNNANARKPTPRNRRRSSCGSSRRSALKKTFAQEQVTFTAPVSSDPHVGIIGGGMAGLACALSLDKRGVKSTVFDTGNHGLGGRMGTRMIGPQPLIFDHAAQFFTVNDSRFRELLERGLVRPWEGVIGELEVGGQFTPFPSSPPKYIGVNGMHPLADSLLAQTSMVSIVRPCWISNLEPFNGMWHLSENVKLRGQFDVVVIAHNGKCANRLLGSSGLPQVARQMKRLELSSIWALLAAFEDPLPLGTKLLNSQSDAPHCWTFFSTAAYGKQNKVPQENIPTATAEKVKTGMLEGVEAALGRPKGSLQKPIYSRKAPVTSKTSPWNGNMQKTYPMVGIEGGKLLVIGKLQKKDDVFKVAGAFYGKYPNCNSREGENRYARGLRLPEALPTSIPSIQCISLIPEEGLIADYLGSGGVGPQRLNLSSIWAILSSFEDPLPLDSAATLEGACVKELIVFHGWR
ncbi:hypothetical protein CUMW_168630 [Citrus unshiu]|uniref:Amine oxidase domain-containing protein n=1 Tax=Citrus unshiu TaxID=55188 RepID=A0A2H5PUK1_CITUN|nr:hypothetical protein CUMW_168630 [Citrus unshiu]